MVVALSFRVPSGWLHQPRQLCGARTQGRWVCAVWRYLGIWLAFVVWTDVLLIHLEIKKKKMHPHRNALVMKAVSLKSPKRQAFLRQAGSVHFFFFSS